MVETHARMAGPEDPNGGAGHPGRASRTETLSYLCDIIHELKHLADRSGQRTLSAILAAALIEARIQNETRSVRPAPRRLTGPEQRDEAVAVPLDAPGERQLDERDLHAADGEPSAAHERIDVDRRRPERGHDAVAVAFGQRSAAADRGGLLGPPRAAAARAGASAASARTEGRPAPSPASRPTSEACWCPPRAGRADGPARRTPRGPARRQAAR